MPSKLQKSLDLLQLIVFGPYYFLLIIIDWYIFSPPISSFLSFFITGNPFLHFPRTIDESCIPQDKLFNLIKNNNPGVLPNNARFVSMEMEGGSEHEPDKNVFIATISYTSDNDSSSSSSSNQTQNQQLKTNKITKLPIFVKLPTARQWSLFFKVIVATFATSNKEVAVYNNILPILKKERQDLGLGDDDGDNNQTTSLGPLFRVPKNIYSTWNRNFDRCILIQNAIDMTEYQSYADHLNGTTEQMIIMLDAVSYLHAQTWKLESPASKYLQKTFFPREIKGVDWINGAIEIYQPTDKKFESQVKMWEAIAHRMKDTVCCISHGDFRIGNTIWNKNFSKVILADLEAVSVTVFMWDLTYTLCVSMSPEHRRRDEKKIIQHYLDNLQNKHGLEDVPSFDEAWKLYQICIIILRYCGWSLTMFGGAGKKHGNSQKDVDSWTEKVKEATLDVFRNPGELADNLGADHMMVRQFIEECSTGQILIGKDIDI